MTDQLLIMTLARDRPDLRHLQQGARLLEFDVAHKRFDRGKPYIAGHRTVTTILLNMG